MTPGALAADVNALPVKAPAAVEAPWWTSGFIEFGGRGFLNDPADGGKAALGQKSLAKFYEYKTEKPGPFGNFNFAAGSANGLYQIEAWGYNPGYSDQGYDAYFTKAGEHYVDVQYDQTPHVYSTGASTPFVYNGNGALTLVPNFGTNLHTAFGAATPGAAWPGSINATQAAAGNALLPSTDLGIRRDTAAVNYRWTPTDSWDVKVDYSNTHRTGSLADQIKLSGSPGSGADINIPKPVDDTTQNFGVNGEYIGTSPWGQRFNAMAGYLGSVYTDNISAPGLNGASGFTVANPYCNPNGAALNCLSASANPGGAMSLPPSNSMNAGTGTIGMDLPVNSRYMGTVTYSGMQQNEQFMPFSINPLTVPSSTLKANDLALLPQQSLNGQINTLLVNNVLTTQITPTLKTKLSYRYYDYDNQTPQVATVKYLSYQDATVINTYAANPLMVGYKKQNGDAEVNWKPVNSVNIGSSYDYERYDFTRYDASSTSENTGKIYADWKPAQWVTVRASANYGERRASNYDYLANVGLFQWNKTAPANTNYSDYYRQFFLDDRDRAQARFQIDVDVVRNLTVTPTLKWQDDEYRLQANQVGVSHDRSLGAGLELAYAATSDLRFLASYMNEQHNQFIWSANQQFAPYGTFTGPYTGTQLWGSDINDRVNTFIFGVNYAVIPSRFELGLNYTLAYATNTSPVYFVNGTTPNPQFPAVTTNFQRIDANAKYVIDPNYTHSLGIPGQVALKLRYAWERNSVTNWNNDLIMPFSPTYGYQQYMAWDNPNYNVHMLAGTVAWAW
jgi:MtrB/PioB family decaheme-associated outer membrane protein